MMSWLEDIETELSNIPALAPYSNDDKIAMLIRAHYTRIPLDKYRQLLTAFVIRDRLCACVWGCQQTALLLPHL